ARATGNAREAEPDLTAAMIAEGRGDGVSTAAVGPASVQLGRGGDASQWVWRTLHPGATWLVCGPGGSGRSTSLAAMVHQVRQQGWHIVRPADLPVSAPAEPCVLVVDDADRLSSAAVDACVTHLRQAEDAGSESGSTPVTVLASARSDGLVTTHHSLALRLRD